MNSVLKINSFDIFFLKPSPPLQKDTYVIYEWSFSTIIKFVITTIQQQKILTKSKNKTTKKPKEFQSMKYKLCAFLAHFNERDGDRKKSQWG